MIRHGETDWTKTGRLQGREDIPLNAEGLRQAEAVADELSQMPWHAVIASPLSRARQTAQVIAQRLGIEEIIEDSRFIERDYGNASGLTAREREQRFPDRQFETMEDWEHLRGRVYSGILDYAKRHPGGDIVIVSHGAAINSVLATLSGGEIGSGKTRLKTACMNMLRYENEMLQIAYYNRPAGEADN
ncbi:MAG: histidine phosphatase family protein [Clostridiales bacterium]|nr:histidine phosphatase family protein [Clostridiales bacterium]